MKLYISILVFSLLPFLLSAQSWWDQSRLGTVSKGYVVTVDNDTIYGTIKYNLPPAMARKVIFWKDGDNSDRHKYKGADLKGFYFEGVFWESHEFNDGSIKISGSQKEKLFLFPLMKGRLDVYEYYTSEIDELIKYEDGVNKVLPEQMQTTVMMKKDGEDFVSLNDMRFFNFKKGMSKYLSDCEDVAKAIADKKIKKMRFMEAFKRYNNCE